MKILLLFIIMYLGIILVSCNSRNIDFLPLGYGYEIINYDNYEQLDDTTLSFIDEIFISKKHSLVELYKNAKVFDAKMRNTDTNDIDYYYNSFNYSNTVKYQNIIDSISTDDKIEGYYFPLNYYYSFESNSYYKSIHLKMIINKHNEDIIMHLYLNKYNDYFYFLFVNDKPFDPRHTNH